MRKSIVAVFCLAACLALLVSSGIAQEEKKAEAVPAQSGPKVESVYGEVLAVNETAQSLTVQYYDYDADEEKNLEVLVNQDSKLENASSLKDVKTGDWVDVDYATSEGGKKVAKTVKVEKAEETSTGEAATDAEGAKR